MGLFVSARCPCGCHGGATVGAGMEDFQESASAPAGCTTCAAVVSVEVAGNDPRCPRCGGDVTVFGTILDEPPPERDVFAITADWRLPDGRTLVVGYGPWPCPACGSLTLGLGISGLFD